MLKILSANFALTVFVALAFGRGTVAPSDPSYVTTRPTTSPSTSPFEEWAPTIVVPAVHVKTTGKLIADCFSGPEYDDLWHSPKDALLAPVQTGGREVRLSVHILPEEMSLNRMISHYVGTEVNDTASLSAIIRRSGKTVTLPQIEEIIKSAPRGEAGLNQRSLDNIFFVVGRDGLTVYLVCVHGDTGQWEVRIRSLDDAGHWCAGERLFF